MPPKVRKVDPEVLKQQFDDWKTKDEFRVWQELQQLSQEVPPASTTSKDLTGKWQPYHNKLFEMTQIFKVKTKLKEFKHEYIRTGFFGQEDKDLEKGNVEKYIIDGFHCSVEKEYGVVCWNLRQNFFDIFKQLEDLSEIKPEDYITRKKALVKSLNDFCKNLAKHIKVGHKVIDEKLQMVLAPLKNLLEINRRLFFFDLKYTSAQDRQVNDFLLKAYTTQYCQCLQECQRILLISNQGVIQIQANPDPRRMFNQLNYKDWRQNKIEQFYLQPMNKVFEKMRQRLLCLMVKGIDYFKTPLFTNVEFLEDLKELINCELISEHLLGEQIKRDQINFMYRVQSIIYEANPLSKEYLLAKDENCIKISIPKLVVYTTILHMRNWIDSKQSDLLKQQNERQKLLNLTNNNNNNNNNNNSNNNNNNNEKDNQQSQSGFIYDKRKQEEEAKRQEQQQKAMEDEIKQQEQLDMDRYGRFWVWEYYCDQTHRQIFDECVEMLRHINLAVRQDIQDELIREGMIPRKDRGSKELKEATENLNKLRQRDNANIDSKMRRPPELWNYPKVVEEKHDFRTIADPKKCYIDGRIEQLESNIKKLSDHLQQNRPQSWNELVDRVVDALKGSYNSTPTIIDQGK